MLNILKLKLKNSYKIFKTDYNKKNDFLKKREPNVRNWKNSIYNFNKNTLSIIPEASRLTLKIIKSYFTIYSKKLEKKSKLKRKKKYINKRLSLHKIFISDGEFKHTNDLVKITIFFYNKQLLNYKKKLQEDIK